MNYKKLSRVADSFTKGSVLSKAGLESAKELYHRFKDIFDKWAAFKPNGKNGVIASDEGEGFLVSGNAFFLRTGCDPEKLAQLCVWANVESKDDLLEYIEYFTGEWFNEISDSLTKTKDAAEEIVFKDETGFGAKYSWEEGAPTIYVNERFADDDLLNKIKGEISNMSKKLVSKLIEKDGSVSTEKPESFSIIRSRKRPVTVHSNIYADKKTATEILEPLTLLLSEKFPEYTPIIKEDSMLGWNVILKGSENVEYKSPSEESLIKVESLEDLENNWDNIFDDQTSTFLMKDDYVLLEEVFDYIHESFEDVGVSASVKSRKSKKTPGYLIVTVE